MNAQAKKPKQTELALTYSVGDWVWCKGAGPNNPRRLLARIESVQPIRTAFGEAWPVRCYYVPRAKRIRRLSGWSQTLEHRRIERALNAAEVVKLRNDGVIPHADSEVLP